MADEPRPAVDDGPSEKAVRNVKLALLGLLETGDKDLLQALDRATLVDPTTIKPALLHLLTDDAEIRAAVGALVPTPGPATLQIGSSDAEHAQNVVDLIEEKMRQALRPDAFRRPTFVR